MIGSAPRFKGDVPESPLPVFVAPGSAGRRQRPVTAGAAVGRAASRVATWGASGSGPSFTEPRKINPSSWCTEPK